MHKSVVMLLCKNRSRDQIDNLLVLLHCLECCPDCNLCLSKSHIPTDQTVHDLWTFHIPFCCLDCKLLILRFLKRKHFFKFFLPDRVLFIDKSFFGLPYCIEFHQIFGNLPDCCLYLALRAMPFLSSKFVKFRLFSICTGILLDLVKLCGKNIKISTISIRNLHIILCHLINFYLFNSPVDSKSMILMHYIVSRFQIRKAAYFLSIITFSFLFLLCLSKNI